MGGICYFVKMRIIWINIKAYYCITTYNDMPISYVSFGLGASSNMLAWYVTDYREINHVTDLIFAGVYVNFSQYGHKVIK